MALLSLVLASSAVAEVREATEQSFLPTWRMLNSEEKQQFIAGYLQGWRDAEKVTGVALGYARENPEKAVDGLEQIKSLYDVSGLAPELLIKAIDLHYSQPENRADALSKAFSAARNALRR